GGLALRCAYAFGGGMTAERVNEHRWKARAAIGEFDIDLRFEATERTIVHCTTSLTPAHELLIPYLPRDLYVLSADHDPGDTVGEVKAAQRGLNTGLLFLTLQEPKFGGALYVQNFTALADYFEALQTQPDGVVGGEWPELGYQPPVNPTGDEAPPVNPLQAGKTFVLSDALVAFETELPADEQQSARQFLDLLADLYPLVGKPKPQHHDWPGRAEATLRDLEASPDATIRHYGHTYVHPYTGSEYPDSMVQLAVLAAIVDYTAWRGQPHGLEKALRAGLHRFYDSDLKVMRRYLPNVGDDKDADAVDSWYLYHPLTNLARMAEKGDAAARSLLADSLDFAIKSAQHFDYVFPIQYKVTDFSVITPARNDDGLGQTDVGGLYAYLMLQAHELFGDEHYVEEAKRALLKARGTRFDLMYQANLTAWGAVAALKLWRMTDDESFRRQSHVFLASFFHNSLMWESNIRTARFFPNFLGVTCLQDAPYMAMYECFESLAAFDEYLATAPEGVDRSARLLTAEYRRYALDRAWFYYPDALPENVLAKEHRNGHVDRQLSFPLEDLYADGQPQGQVGQEIYGCGAAFVFATHAFLRFENAPFLAFCEYPLRQIDRLGERQVLLRVDGAPDLQCALRLIGEAPGVSVRMNGKAVPRRVTKAHIEFIIPGGAELTIAWKE
ncbi:MAG: hypothetical protein BGN86_15170, partial [Caulobacterales bacterium 68-7]